MAAWPSIIEKGSILDAWLVLYRMQAVRVVYVAILDQLMPARASIVSRFPFFELLGLPPAMMLCFPRWFGGSFIIVIGGTHDLQHIQHPTPHGSTSSCTWFLGPGLIDVLCLLLNWAKVDFYLFAGLIMEARGDGTDCHICWVVSSPLASCSCFSVMLAVSRFLLSCSWLLLPGAGFGWAETQCNWLNSDLSHGWFHFITPLDAALQSTSI